MEVNLVIIPGMCCVASAVYAPLIAELKKENIEQVHLVELPSCDPVSTQIVLKPNALQVDIEKIKRSIEEVLQKEDQDVIVVAHSYGGTPTLYACEGLWKSQRSAEQPSVLRVALISSSLSLPGNSVVAVRMEYGKTHGGVDDSGANIKTVGQELLILPDPDLASALFNDMSESDIKKWGDTLRPSAFSALMTPTPAAATENWKLSYLVTTELDISMPEDFQRHLVEAARAAGATVDIEEIKSGHFPQITHAPEVAQWIKQLCQ